MTTMKHMADEATWDKAKELAILAQDPTKLHKTAFLEYLEVKARQLAEDRAIDEVETELRAVTNAWKQAAKAKARKR